MTDLFPVGSTQAPSEARDEIWERWPDFAALADELLQLGTELRAAARTGEPARTAKAPQIGAQAEWDAMEVDVLLGLKTIEVVDPIVTGAIAPGRGAAEVFSQITQTCSSCHAAFRH